MFRVLCYLSFCKSLVSFLFTYQFTSVEWAVFNVAICFCRELICS